MSTVGFYRLKVLADTQKDVSVYINTEEFTKTVVPIDTCPGFRLLKYLDRNGQYRFYPFSNFYSIKDNPEKIGSASKLLTSILTDKTNKQNVGYRNERVLQLTADVSETELEKLQDIYVSPRVYLYVGENNSDLDKDWIEVEAKANDAIVRRSKGGFGSINLTVTLPEHFTIKMT